MALERNNKALQFEPGFDAEFAPEFAPEFASMLERHLRHGGAPVAACLGFDADAASAFLENALNASARSQYESHLAGCPACRRHLIELSRLGQLVPQLETAPQVTTAAPPVWAKWKTAVAEWFDVSEWRWNWQTAGLAGAATAVLVATVAIRPWNRADHFEAVASPPGSIAPSQADMAFGAASPTPEIVAGSGASQPAEANYQAESLSREKSDARMLVAPALPTPDAEAKQNEQALAFNLPPRAPKDLRDGIPSPFSATPPMPVSRSLPAPPFSSRASLAQNVAIQELAAAPPQVPEPLAGENKEAPEKEAPEKEAPEKEAADAPNRLGPSSEDNPMRSDPAKPENARRRESDKSKTKAGWIDRVMAFAPYSKDRGDKPAPVIRNEEENRFLMVRIHNRVFRFENGEWVDNEYKDELMRWRVTRLIRGSEEFNRVLADEPQLKPYFDKTPILVIWRDKIYKVVAK
ncbi:MAG: zf-HC2 domain-containing protein [Blastocatellia bacterium]